MGRCSVMHHTLSFWDPDLSSGGIDLAIRQVLHSYYACASKDRHLLQHYITISLSECITLIYYWEV